MGKINRYRPNFVSGFPDESASFDDLAGLLAVPWVGAFKDANFHRFSQDGTWLMAEYHGGAKWWVVGRLDAEVPGLPIWDSKEAVRLRDAKEGSSRVTAQDDQQPLP